jgi:hypothetical protein
MKALGHTFDLLLTFQVKGTGGRSDEAMRHLQDHIRPGAFSAFSQRRTLNAITLAKRDDFLALHVHNRLLSLLPWGCSHQTLATWLTDKTLDHHATAS